MRSSEGRRTIMRQTFLSSPFATSFCVLGALVKLRRGRERERERDGNPTPEAPELPQDTFAGSPFSPFPLGLGEL
mgnify:CR=1 FL=1